MSTRSLPWRWRVSRFGLFLLDRRKWEANPLDFATCRRDGQGEASIPFESTVFQR